MSGIHNPLALAFHAAGVALAIVRPWWPGGLS